MSALRHGFAILNTVTGSGQGMTFSEIVEATGLPKASVHRLLKELVAQSALTLDPESRRYQGGLLLARLGAAVTGDYDLRRIARPALQAIHDQTGHVATLGIRDGAKGVYLDKIEPTTFGLRLHSEVGKSFPLHCTAMGKVMLSQAGEATLRAVAGGGLERFTENTITSIKALRRELRQVAEQGFALDREEITRGLVCMAAPVWGPDGTLAGAMSCTVPSYLADERGLDRELAIVMREAAAVSGLPPVQGSTAATG